jgi:rhodanese-related sulfurtransferase
MEPLWSDIMPEELESRLGDQNIQMIDVRELKEFKEVHIPGVFLLPLSQLDVRYQDLDRGIETICICRSGNRSTKACEFLSSRGFKNLRNLTGGMLGWRGRIVRSS